MKICLVVGLSILLTVSTASTVRPVQKVESSFESPVKIHAVPEVVLPHLHSDASEVLGDIPEFVPPVVHFLKLENEEPQRRLFMDTTDYNESPEQVVSLNSSGTHFRTSHNLIDDLGVPPVVDLLVTALEAIPTHPAVLFVDNWAQETRAGFMGYLSSLTNLFERESGSVENKLFEAADAYSHRFFNLVHVKESDHPVLAAKMTRIILAMVLSLTLVFIIFGIALHLQRTLVAKAHEEAAKQTAYQPTPEEELFFAMPYPHLREGRGLDETNIVIVNNEQRRA